MLEERQAVASGAGARPSHDDGADIDLAYNAIFDALRDDVSGSTEAKLARAARALPSLAAGPEAILGDATQMSSHVLRARLKAQTNSLLDLTPAAKPDAASQGLWQQHPWRLADGSSPISLSELNAQLASIEAEIEAFVGRCRGRPRRRREILLLFRIRSHA